jgi:hypothetical protein
MWLDPATFKITRINIKELTEDSKKLTAYYSDFEEINDHLFPFRLDYEVAAETPIEVRVKYSKIELNESLNFPFKIPSKYKPAN